MPDLNPPHLAEIRRDLDRIALELGFAALGVADIDLAADERRLEAWLAAGMHGQMHYMARHGTRRSRPQELVPGTVRVISVRMDYWPDDAAVPEASRPQELVPGTVRVISVRMDYWPDDAAVPEAVLADPALAYVSRYALGRDYHKVMRRALRQLADRIAARVGPFGYRVFVDSGPVLEKPLARNAGLGWLGKHTNLIARDAGSWFFLGELYTDLPLPADAPASAHCGSCEACLPACPTAAIVAPGKLDARRCISYLTIELQDRIPVELRPLLGNRIYGCDDCQLVCPWNKFAKAAAHPDFKVRHGLDAPRLAALFAWTRQEFETRMAGSAIHRIGHERWLRNIAVALGNAPRTDEVVAALRARASDESALVREHVEWALGRHQAAGASDPPRH